jgi:uncharacterized protein (TIGR03435 family)
VKFAAVLLFVPVFAWSQASSAQFEAASIKRNPECRVPGKQVPTPGRVSLQCITLQTMIQAAYGFFANGVARDPKTLEVTGGPGWVATEFYDVAAKAEGNPKVEQMIGPTMQGLLENRFKLKVHRASKEVPVYDLVTAKGGPRLERTKEGACIPIDLNRMPPRPTPGEAGPTMCGTQNFQFNGPLATMTAHGMTMEQLAGERLPRLVDRLVIDKTGLTGMFDFRLEFLPERRPESRDTTPTADATGPNIFAALQQQLGLKLEPAKGSLDILVIDHVERPTEN